MFKSFIYGIVILLLFSCSKMNNQLELNPQTPELQLDLPAYFPDLNASFHLNKPTKYGVKLGEKLFHENKLSGNNTISCASCHNPKYAFSDHLPKAVGVENRVGMRNTPALQNLAFMKFYNWDGSMLSIERQALVPIISHQEMNSKMQDVIEKLNSSESGYKKLFKQAFGSDEITAEKIFRSLAQYQYTLISSQCKYDRVMQHKDTFTARELQGYNLFQLKCEICHSGSLFTDESFRNIGFPMNPDTQEIGRARVSTQKKDMYRFRVPSLRNVELTAPYGSFGQFSTVKQVLDYLDNGVLDSDNLDPILKSNGHRIPMSEQEKLAIIAFLETLTDSTFLEY